MLPVAAQNGRRVGTASTTAGNPALLALIREEIAEQGPMTMARFMELALYHPDYGYYTNQQRADARPRIGWTGDYYTSADVHGALGWALAKQADQLDAVLGRPAHFTILEMGPGKGLLARDILQACAQDYPSLFSRLHYVLIDRSPDHRASQQEVLARYRDRPGLVNWVPSLDEIEPESVVGLVLSNELVDAFPIHRVVMRKDGLQERRIACEDERLLEIDGPLSSRDLARYFDRIGVTLSPGAVADVNLAALAWITSTATRLKQGLVLTLDYGHRAEDLYGLERRGGTLRAYANHTVSDDLLTAVGEQDLTSHVDFTSLAQAGAAAGLTFAGFTNQMHLLISLGIESYCAALPEGSDELLAIAHLLRPHGMGTTFKVLYQQKAMPETDWRGLRHRPFLDGTLDVPALRGEGE